ncbi:nitroreductase family protein [Pseudorhodoferax sp. LjRoot39]|uniref:nitroreductase family protein n=1 Tax=Pseudorhodoferax sp. LjRoot39 TaxID=3342328 RepID=UPI003F4FC90A
MPAMMIDAPLTEAIAPQALDLLLSRRSPWPLVEPIPSEAELQRAFAAAMCAPDHGALRPWRFVLVRGAARERLGELFVQAARLRDPAGDAERFRRKALVAPLLVAVVAHLQPHPKVPEIEQTVATGAATMNLLNALHLQGYGCFWVSGPNAYDPTVHAGLGLAPNERLLGFVYVGTPQNTGQRPAGRADPAPHVREWRG